MSVFGETTCHMDAASSCMDMVTGLKDFSLRVCFVGGGGTRGLMVVSMRAHILTKGGDRIQLQAENAMDTAYGGG